ncbi:hypothetical protein [Treponema sp. R80B11-R83G3]
MFSALLNNGVTLLAALLGNLKEIKHLRAKICIMLIFCAAMLVLAVIIEKKFTWTKKTPQPLMYSAPVFSIPDTPEDITAGNEDIIIKIEIKIPKGIERMPMNFSISLN